MGRDSVIEDITMASFSDAQQGPTVTQNHKLQFFKVNLAGLCCNWLTDPTKIMPTGTLGQANVKSLHDKLDEFIARYLQEHKND